MLKETLLRHGFEFESDTDTEVIPKLAKFVYDRLTEGELLSPYLCLFIYTHCKDVMKVVNM